MSAALLKLSIGTLVVLGIVAVVASAAAAYGLMLAALALFPEWVTLISILAIVATVAGIYFTASYFAQLILAKKYLNSLQGALQRLLAALDLNPDGTEKK